MVSPRRRAPSQAQQSPAATKPDEKDNKDKEKEVRHLLHCLFLVKNCSNFLFSLVSRIVDSPLSVERARHTSSGRMVTIRRRKRRRRTRTKRRKRIKRRRRRRRRRKRKRRKRRKRRRSSSRQPCQRR